MNEGIGTPEEQISRIHKAIQDAMLLAGMVEGSWPENYEEIADTLDELQAAENGERGISCVRSIVTYLRRGDFERAQNVRQIDGDKTRSYPKVEGYLTRVFGCRLHGNHNCIEWLCATRNSED